METLLKIKWMGLKGALGAGDIASSLQYFIDPEKDRYQTLFRALLSQLPAIVMTFNELNITETYDNIAEYEIVANEDGILYSYPGLFVKDDNGIWKFQNL